MRKLKNNKFGRIIVDEFKTIKKTPLIVVLDNIRSLNNIGSFFRTSDAFLIEKIYLCGITATPPKLKKENVRGLAIEQAENSTKLNTFFPKENQKYAIVMGNEVKGVQQVVLNASDFCIEILQFGTELSLNISVTCGVVLWSLFAKFIKE